MAKAKQLYQVVAELVLVKVGGAVLYFYKGSFLPPEADPDDVQRHVDSGMVVPVDGPAGIDIPDAVLVGANGGAAAQVPTLDKPRGNASKDDWLAYAEQQGMNPDQAEAMSRDELAAAYAD